MTIHDTRKTTGGKRWRLAATSLVTVAATMTPAVGGTAAEQVPGFPGGVVNVTLVTGDRVAIAPGGAVTVVPRPERSGVTYRTVHAGRHVFVVPSDAERLLRTGRLDRRLFDITTLVEDGYADGHAPLPLILTDDTAAGTLSADGLASVRNLPALRVSTVHADRARLPQIWARLRDRPAGKVWLDGKRQVSLDVSVPAIGAPAAWQAGHDGTGVVVGVLDTGVDATHPDLAGRITAAHDFTHEADGRDRVGHGTHVASTIVGGGNASGGGRKGVAPGARILAGKVCTQDGCPDSAILAGMQWVVEQGADVVNLSLGGADTVEIDPLEQAVDTLSAQHDVLFVIAAGNGGRDRTVGSPGTADMALTVGAVDKAFRLAGFSSRGPRIGDAGLKPDITAPGVDIAAARSADAVDLGEPGAPYTTMSGTSMATPHVAGAAAILRQQHPDWTSARLKAHLIATAAPSPDIAVTAQGAGRVDVARAHRQNVSTTTGSISLRRQLWPHHDDVPIERSITYTNPGQSPVTLQLSLVSAGDTAMPTDMFRLSATSLTVPAGGSASVTLHADTRTGTVTGWLGGHVRAVADDIAIVTPFGVEREAEHYDLTLTHIDERGEPARDYATALLNLDTFDWIDLYGDGTTNTLTQRLPRGRYMVASEIRHGRRTMLAQPAVEMSADQRVNLDARAGRAVRISVPFPNARRMLLDVAAVGHEPGWTTSIASRTTDPAETIYIGPAGTNRPSDRFSVNVYAYFAEANAAGDTTASPYSVNLAWMVPGRMVAGFERKLGPKDLATVRTRFAESMPGLTGERIVLPVLPGQLGGNSWYFWPVALPSTRVEYFNDTGLHWLGGLDEIGSNGFSVSMRWDLAATRYRAGKQFDVAFNQAVFGPSAESQQRRADQLFVTTNLFSDGVGRGGSFSVHSAHHRAWIDGQLVVDEPTFGGIIDVPAESRHYRIEFVAERHAPYSLSTRVELEWTFHSARGQGERQLLPVATIRFTPPVDLHNAVPAGSRHTVPITFTSLTGATPTQLSVEASFDDGATWQAVSRTANGRAVVIDPPAGAQFVSLRAHATDSGGSTVRQTVLHAYRIAAS